MFSFVCEWFFESLGQLVYTTCKTVPYLSQVIVNSNEIILHKSEQSYNTFLSCFNRCGQEMVGNNFAI